MVRYLAPKMLKISRLTLLLLEPREEKQAQVVIDRRSPDRRRRPLPRRPWPDRGREAPSALIEARQPTSAPLLAGSRPGGPLCDAIDRIEVGQPPP